MKGENNRIGLKAIAQAAGVSHSTVSRALRNEPSISPATTERIQKLAQRLGYRPDPALSALVAYRARVQPVGDYGKLAILDAWPQSPSPDHPLFFRRQLEGIRDQAAARGYETELFPLSQDPRQQRLLGRMLRSRGLRGVIVGPLPQECRALNLEWRDFSAVAIGYSLIDPALHFVASNHIANFELAYFELRRMGYRNIGYCARKGSERRNRHLHLSAYLRCRFLDEPSARSPQPLLYEIEEDFDPLPWMIENQFDAIIAGNADLLNQKLGDREIKSRVLIADLSLPAASGRKPGVLEDMEDLGTSAVDLLDTLLKTTQRGLKMRALF